MKLNASKSLLLITFTLFSFYAIAQTPTGGGGLDPLGSGLDQATTNLTSNMVKIKKFLYIIAGIIATYGTIIVYGKFQNQDQDTSKAMGKFGFGFVFFAAAGYIIDAAFI